MRALGKFLLGTLAVVGFLFLALVGLAWWGFSSLDIEDMMAERAERPDQMVLTLDLRRPFPEGDDAGPLSLLPEAAPLPLSATVRAIDVAAKDPDVRGILAEVGGTQAGIAQVQELRDAVKRFRQSGKPAIVFAETMNEGNDSLDAYLSSSFDEVWLQPSGGVGPLGFAAEVPFLHNLLQEMGVEPQFAARENHKSAVDSFTRDSMSPYQRESLEEMLGGFWSQFVMDVSADRNLSADAVRQMASRSPLLSGEALESGLVDRLGYRHEVESEVRKRANTQGMLPFESYARGILEDEASAVPRLALIQASGPISRGSPESGPFGGGGIYSDVLSDAIHEAMEDGSIEAIVLRIDSPGGSYVASDTVWNTLRQAREKGMPVVVSMGNVAASGGYFIAMAGDHIVAERGTVTGSIGVISGKFALSDLWRNLDVTWNDVSVGGGQSLMYSPNQSFTDEQWVRFEQHLDWIYNDFVSKVADARGMSKQQVRAVAGGRIWTGEAALKNGLVDSLGGMNEAVAEAKILAGISGDTPVTLVPFPKPSSGLDRVLAALGGAPLIGADSESIAALARLVKVLDPVTRRVEAMEQGPLRAPLH